MPARNDSIRPVPILKSSFKIPGSTTLTSLDIEYYVEGGDTENYEWTGSLEFLEKETVILPIPELTFWLGTFDKFTVIYQ